MENVDRDFLNLFASGERRQLSRLRRQFYLDLSSHVLPGRKRGNPARTPEEHQLGVYLEELEPQVREAVREFNRKGYTTVSSGFYGDDYQAIEGHFFLDDQTKDQLTTMGVSVKTEPWWKWRVSERAGSADPATPTEERFITRVEFPFRKPDLQAMEAKWRAVAGVLPDRSQTRHHPTGTG